jgi:hypothetical protein
MKRDNDADLMLMLVFILMALFFMSSCSTIQPIINQAQEKNQACVDSGGSMQFEPSTLTLKCVKPEPQNPEPKPDPKPEPEPEPKPEPEKPPVVPGDWRKLEVSESIIMPYKKHIEFQVKGLDTRNVKEWHLWDIAHGRGKKIETANVHMMIYNDTMLYLIQQAYKPALDELRHEDYWAFRPDKVYTWVLKSNLHGYRLKIYEGETLVVDMPQAKWGAWPVTSFQRIDNFRIGCGTFGSHPCPRPIWIKLVE